MSTTFDVFPSTPGLPTFAALLDATLICLHNYLARHGINARPLLDLSIKTNDGDNDVTFAKSDPLKWEDGTYAWFGIEESRGGTDVYFETIDEETNDDWHEDLAAAGISQCLTVGHYWSFRRSAGQPAIINLTYGLLAGTLAKLTDGFVWSDDCAWDHQHLPATGTRFLDLYFDPDKTTDKGHKDWANRCIKMIRHELNGDRNQRLGKL